MRLKPAAFVWPFLVILFEAVVLVTAVYDYHANPYAGAGKNRYLKADDPFGSLSWGSL